MGLMAWGRRLDDRLLPRPKPGQGPPTRMARVGLLALIIFGGGGLLRLVFQDETATPGWALWLYFTVAVLGMALLLADAVRKRR